MGRRARVAGEKLAAFTEAAMVPQEWVSPVWLRARHRDANYAAAEQLQHGADVIEWDTHQAYRWVLPGLLQHVAP